MRKAFVKTLTDLAARDPDVMLLTGDLGFSVFEEFAQNFPRQYLNAGLSEQCMVGMAAGLAMEGKKVFVYSIIPFIAFRALEQVRDDLCYQHLPVKLIGVGSGFVYGRLGGTHHAIDDVGVMTSLPQMTVFSPGDPLETAKITEFSMTLKGPCYVRLNRAGDPTVHTEESISAWRPGEPLRLAGNGSGIAVLAMGNALPLAVQVGQGLQSAGRACSVYSVPTLKPVDEQKFLGVLEKADTVVCIEEHVQSNGLTSLVAGLMAAHAVKGPLRSFALADEFSHSVGSQEFLQRRSGLTVENILKKIEGI